MTPVALSLALLLTAPAAAEDPPLAIPGGGPPPAEAQRPPPRSAVGERPRRLSPEKLRALQQYKAQRLEIRSETILHGGGTSVWTGWGGPYWGTRVHVTQHPVFTTRDWGFYQGPQRLTVPTALELAGDPRAVELAASIDRRQRRAKTWFSVAGVGGAGVAAGIVGQAFAQDRDDWVTWSSVALGGAVTAVVGMIGGAGPAGDARRLENVPAATLAPGDAQQVVDGHNKALAEELGLSPDEVWSVEQPVGR